MRQPAGVFLEATRGTPAGWRIAPGSREECGAPRHHALQEMISTPTCKSSRATSGRKNQDRGDTLHRYASRLAYCSPPGEIRFCQRIPGGTLSPLTRVWHHDHFIFNFILLFLFVYSYFIFIIMVVVRHPCNDHVQNKNKNKTTIKNKGNKPAYSWRQQEIRKPAGIFLRQVD